MKKHEILELNDNLQKGNLDELRGSKFLYALDKNMQKLKTEAESIQKAGQASKEYQDTYDAERIKINEKYAKKNADGSAKMERRGDYLAYIIEERNVKEYQAKLEALDKKCQALVDKRRAEIKEYSEVFLEEESDFVPHYIEESDLPEDITWGQRKLISLLIKRDESDEPKKAKPTKKE